MSTTHKNRQSPIRVNMQKRGYAWVPNNGKRTRGADWPDQALKRLNNKSFGSVEWWDEAIVEDKETGNPHHLENPSTGLLIQGDLVALDVDIDNQDAVEKLFDLACSIFGEAWENDVLIRCRKGSEKECWLFRVAPPEKGDLVFPSDGKVVGPKYWPPGTPEEFAEGDRPRKDGGWVSDVPTAQIHTIEIFRGGKCQIGTHGWHTVPDPDRGVDGIEYEWLDGKSPANVYREDVPEVTHAQLHEFYASYGGVLEQTGWVRDLRSQNNASGRATYVYDLDPEATLYTGTRGAPEAIDQDALETGDSVRMREIIGEGDNPERGHCYRKKNGALGVFDYELSLWHYPRSEDPELNRVRAEKLGAMLQDLHPCRESGGKLDEGDDKKATETEDDVFSRIVARVAEILDREGVAPSVEGEELEEIIEAYADATWNWAAAEDDQVEARSMLLSLRYLYVHFAGGARAGSEWISLIPGTWKSLGANQFKKRYRNKVVVDTGKKDQDGNPKTAKVKVTDIFAESDLPVEIEGVQFLPGTPFTVGENAYGRLVQNTYTTPETGTVRPELVQLWKDFCEWIFDREDELAIWHECFAFKFQHISARGVTHILVANGVEGVGRNTMVEDMLFDALGRVNCGLIDEDILQSQFNDWRLDTLLHFAPEMKTLPRASRDKLKSVCDVKPTIIKANVKYGVPREEEAGGTMVIATNEGDVLPLDMRTDNRRFNIYDNGRKGPLRKNPDLETRVNAVRNGVDKVGVIPDMAASIRHYYEVVWAEENDRQPRYEVFMQGTDTVAKVKMGDATKKPTDRYIEEVLEQIEETGATYVEVGAVVADAQRLARGDDAHDAVRMMAEELKKTTSGGNGFTGWVRVISAEGGDRLKVEGNRKKAVLAKGQDAADAFVLMSHTERSEVLACSGKAERLARTAEALKGVKDAA